MDNSDHHHTGSTFSANEPADPPSSARREGPPLEKLATWAVVGGIIGAHLVHLFLYHPEELRENGPLQLFKVWGGLSSTGGALGGIVACVVFLRTRGIRFATYADVFALAVPPGRAIACLGCFLGT